MRPGLHSWRECRGTGRGKGRGKGKDYIACAFAGAEIWLFLP